MVLRCLLLAALAACCCLLPAPLPLRMCPLTEVLSCCACVGVRACVCVSVGVCIGGSVVDAWLCVRICVFSIYLSIYLSKFRSRPFTAASLAGSRDIQLWNLDAIDAAWSTYPVRMASPWA